MHRGSLSRPAAARRLLRRSLKRAPPLSASDGRVAALASLPPEPGSRTGCVRSSSRWLHRGLRRLRPDVCGGMPVFWVGPSRPQRGRWSQDASFGSTGCKLVRSSAVALLRLLPPPRALEGGAPAALTSPMAGGRLGAVLPPHG